MPKVPLIQGAYSARGVLANAQRCVNLLPEPNPRDAPFPVTHYPTSGLGIFADYSGSLSGPVRGLYWSSAYNQLFAAVGSYLIESDGWGNGYTMIGYIGDNGNPVSMVDNGTDMFVVDGTAVPPGGTGPPATGGWTFALNNPAGTFAAVTDPAFNGSQRVDFIDTFFVFHWPGTPTFYASLSNSTAFDGTYWSEKTGYSDNVMSIAALHDNLWIFGVVTTEIWFDAGTAGLPFMRMPNSVIQAGCIAPYSPVVADNGVFWLSQDRWGRAQLMRGDGYVARKVSNFAIESEWATYTNLSDCIGMGYTMAGHAIVLLYFPSANATWAYDTATNMWHRRAYGNDTTAWLPRATAYWGASIGGSDVPLWGAENVVLAGDRTAPRILYMYRDLYTDVGTPIQRIRSWPHILNDQKRLSHSQFAAALQPGQLSPDTVQLRWSDDGGQTFGNYVPQNVTNGFPSTYGQYSWRRLGLGRDRVYELSWTSQGETALNGAWIEVGGSET